MGVDDPAQQGMTTQTTELPGALSPFRVLELASRRAAYCGKLLAGLGADVVLIEPPGGHPSRRPSPSAGDRPGRLLSPFFTYMHAGKRSVTVDLDDADGRRKLVDLASTADVLIDPFQPGYLDGLGLGFEGLSRRNPGLVMTSVTGFGLTGPNRDLASSDLVAYAMGGLMSLNGHGDTPPLEPAGEPAYVVGSLNAACATVMALYSRLATGRGQHVDVSLQESVAQLTNWTGVGVYLYDRLLRTRSSIPPGSTPIGNFPCKDGYISIQIASPNHWETLAEWMAEKAGVRDALDPELRGPAMRRVHRAEEIDEWMRRLSARYTKQEFVAEGQRKHLPVAPVSDPSDLESDVQLAARGYWSEVELDDGERVKTPGAPYRLSRTPWAGGPRAPGVGEHNGELLSATARPATGLRPFGDAREAAGDAAGDAGNGGNPFDGLRVIELSTGIGGPYLGRILAHHGAEVVKVESTRRLENIRSYVPSFDRSSPPLTDMHPGLQEWHAGKLHLGLNLNDPEGLGVLQRLVAVSDVLLVNYSVGAVDRLGVGSEAMLAVNPNLIWVGMFGYGDSGPYRDYLAWGPQIEAMSGISHLTAVPGGIPSRGVFYPDYVAAFHGLLAMTAALLHRARTGRGQRIDLSMLEATVSTIGPVVLDQTANGRTRQPTGNRSPDAAPHGCYRCRGDSDEGEWCVIAVETEAQWQGLCAAMGQPSLAGDPRFRDLPSRLRDQDALDAIVGAWTRQRERYEVMDTLQRAGVPAGVVQTIEDLVRRDEHIRSRDYLMEQHHQRRGQVYGTGLAIRLGEPSQRARRSGVNIGHDNAYLLGEVVGLPQAELARLEAAGVVERQ